MRSRVRVLLLFCVALAFAFVSPMGLARAEDPPQQQLPKRQANFTWQKTEKGASLLLASFSYRDVVDSTIAEKLASGLPTVIALRAYVLREGEANPVALAVRTCRVVYDLWDEVYRVNISGPGGTQDLAAMNLEGVLRQCTDVRDLVVTNRALLAPAQAHFIGAIVEVNPISPGMLDQMRRWVSRPAGSTGIGPGDALFGSFVGLFVRQIGTAARTLRFRTQSFTP
ncbi:hypothetical protein [Labilithrix luteola]|uniref:hypothetical protein n=1 Tax=Labilithrix luteola TaxID=1391654 RepID=UPI0011BABA63|nr:hypothetical protein [Labilithrix luteola]